MTKILQMLGDVAAILGVLACTVSGVARLAHIWTLGGIQVPALFELGIGLMVFGCLAKLHALPAMR